MLNTTIQPNSSAAGCYDVTMSHMLPGEGTIPALDMEPANSPRESLSPLGCLTEAGQETWAPWERRRTQGRGLLGHQQLPDGANREGWQKPPEAAASSPRGHPCEITGDDWPRLSSRHHQPGLPSTFLPVPARSSTYRVSKKKKKKEKMSLQRVVKVVTLWS